MDCVEDVTFVSWGPENISDPKEWNILSDLNLKFNQIDEKINELDILIEGSLYIASCRYYSKEWWKNCLL